MISGSPGQFSVALEHFHQAGVLVMSGRQAQGYLQATTIFFILLFLEKWLWCSLLERE